MMDACPYGCDFKENDDQKMAAHIAEVHRDESGMPDLGSLMGAVVNALNEPDADARAGAKGMFQTYQAYVQAGFTEKQSMQIICTMLDAAVRNAP